MSRQPPTQELVAKDLHGNEWRFRHIFRGMRSNLCVSSHRLYGYYFLVFFICLLTEVVIKLYLPLSAGQPRRHLLQSGWSVFVSSKRLVAGDAFIFLRFACTFYEFSF